MEIIIRSNAVETSSQGDSSEMNLYNLYPYYELALAKTSLLGELSAKITKTLLNSAKVKLKQQRILADFFTTQSCGSQSEFGKVMYAPVDRFLSFVNIQHRSIADNFPEAI